MNIKFKNWIFIVSVIMLTLSCNSDILDKKPLDAFSEVDVWRDASLAEGFIFDTYSSAIGLYVNQNTDEWTDNIINNVDNGGSKDVQSSSFENNRDFGWNQYWRIRRCNLAIEKLAEAKEIDESIRKRLTAEAKALRGMIYFWKARRFGGLMIVDGTLEPDQDFKLPRASEQETYDFILQDLREAVPDLPETAEVGRMTKAAVHAFITMVALQAGEYQDVVNAANEVENAGFMLDDDYYNIFNDYNTTLNSPENIFIYHAGEDNNVYINTRMFRQLCNVLNGEKLHADAIPQYSNDDEFQGWPLRFPSQELIDAYLIVENGTAVQKSWQDFQGNPSRDAWKNRDLRMDKSIVRDSSFYSRSYFTFRRGGNAHWTSNPLSDWGMSKSGYMIRKWNYELDFIFWNFPVTWAEPILRLGEVYLNKAEALGRLGDIPQAIQYLNKTRTVHGGLPPLSEGASPEEFWRFYKLERRVELAFEDDRYWSLIRWAKAENANSIPELDGYRLHAQDMQFDGLFNAVESTYTVDMRFDVPRRLLFPVPLQEIRNNENLTQNPGW